MFSERICWFEKGKRSPWLLGAVLALTARTSDSLLRCEHRTWRSDMLNFAVMASEANGSSRRFWFILSEPSVHHAREGVRTVAAHLMVSGGQREEAPSCMAFFSPFILSEVPACWIVLTTVMMGLLRYSSLDMPSQTLPEGCAPNLSVKSIV